MKNMTFYETMNIRLTQIDGKLPNIALMKLSHFFRAQGATVYFEQSVKRGMFEPEYDAVFGSAIFSSSQKKIDLFRSEFPTSIVGGTGSDSKVTVEEIIEQPEYEKYDYSIYPDYQDSIGFTQRGCRLRCKFCVVPEKEGKVKQVNTLRDLWRGEGFPRNILLLDNDFFGQPRWKELCQEAIDENFKVSFSQGINIRLIHQEGAQMLSRVKYYDSKFSKRRIYTAWDNKRDEKIFLRGINYLLDSGIPPAHIMVYFLCNYWEPGLTADVWYRFEKMVELGVDPYPMVYDKPNASREMKDFQRWVIRRNYRNIPFVNYNRSGRAKDEKNIYSLFN